MTIKIFALAFASFAFGFGLCNVIHVFFSPYGKRNDRNSKASRTDKECEDRNDL